MLHSEFIIVKHDVNNFLFRWAPTIWRFDIPKIRNGQFEEVFWNIYKHLTESRKLLNLYYSNCNVKLV